MKGFIRTLSLIMLPSVLFAATNEMKIYQTQLGCMACHQGVTTNDQSPKSHQHHHHHAVKHANKK